MAQVPETIQNPGDSIEVQEFARAVARVINGDLSFGAPTDEIGGGGNGRKDNMTGSWVVKTIAALDFGTAVTFTHNLKTSVNGIGTTHPNVIWPIVCWRSAENPPPLMTLAFEHGDTVTEDAIQLRPASGAVVVSGATVAVFFMVAPPW